MVLPLLVPLLFLILNKMLMMMTFSQVSPLQGFPLQALVPLLQILMIDEDSESDGSSFMTGTSTIGGTSSLGFSSFSDSEDDDDGFLLRCHHYRDFHLRLWLLYFRF